jgi:hypothetical protein
MDESLINKIYEFAKTKDNDCSRLGIQEASSIIKNAVAVFGFDLNNRYVWEGICIEQMIEYKNNHIKWEQELTLALDKFDNQIYLVITNDEFFPWPILAFNKTYLIEILQEHQFFEYFILDKRMKDTLFDTHHNQLMSASGKLHLS